MKNLWYRIWLRLRNIKYWLPILFSDRDWDSYYIFIVLRTKLRKHQAWLKRGYAMEYVGIERDIKKLHLCELLLSRLIENDYDSMLGREIKMSFGKDRRVLFETVKAGCKLGLCNDWLHYEDYMQKQDLGLLCKLLCKHILSWWD